MGFLTHPTPFPPPLKGGVGSLGSWGTPFHPILGSLGYFLIFPFRNISGIAGKNKPFFSGTKGASYG